MDNSYKITRLDNGLRIATSAMPYMESVAVGVWIGCGSRYENNKINGVSHFIEHYVFKGTRKRTGEEICEAIEGVGGEINASTSEESTVYYVRTIREKLDTAAEILLDMVINADFKKEFFEKQRDIVFDEIHMYEDDPQHHVEDVFNGLIWENHPLGYNILGTVENMGRISRKDVVEYKQKNYCSNNCTVAAAGNIDHDRFVSLVRRNTRNLKNGSKISYKPFVGKQAKPGCLVEKRKTEQAHMIIGVPGLKWSHPKRYALKIMSTILGENMSSRLFNSVREEKGYAYSISTGIDRFLDAGSFCVSAGIITEKIVPAIKLILKELARIAGVKTPKKEFLRAKEFIRGNIMMNSERPMSRLHWLGESLCMADKVDDVDATIERVMNVSEEEVRGLAKTLFRNEKLNLAIIGDVGDGDSLKKILRFS